MMVPKIAVIALVLIFGLPILLGYAFNLTETTETDYRASGEAVNVTPLLQNDTGYSYAHGEIYQMNTSTGITLPYYTTITTTKSSMPMTRSQSNSWSGIGTQPLAGVSYYYIEPHYDHTAQDISVEVYQNGASIGTTHNFHTLYYNSKTGEIHVEYYQFGNIYATTITGGNFNQLIFNNSVPALTPFVVVDYANSSTTTYADLASGFYFSTQPNRWTLDLPTDSKSILLTIDLDSITNANYLMPFFDTFNSAMALKKTTVGSDVTWQLTSKDGLYVYTDIYYDSSRSGNTIQMLFEVELLEATSATMGNFQHNIHIDYVGDWPKLIGKANSYWHYELNRTASQYLTADLSEIRFGNTTNSDNSNLVRSPTMRVDDSYYRAFEYPIIGDQTYTPADFKTNPTTTIGNPTQYGTSLTFGGNTYTVSKEGKITISGHEVPVKDLVLSSVPNDLGTYDNKIGNTVISTTADPSTITFSGKWSASISTQSMESYTYTKTEWNAGSFGWDGVDTNFLMVGLLTCVGVFVALGIYARKKGSGGLIPLMIAVGCAAMVFFIML